MSSEHLVGTSIPRFTFDTPTKPGNDFYALCEGEQPLVMIFLPAFDHPVTREYLTHYLKTCARLRGVRLACVVRSSARTVAQATQGAEFPFPIICDAPGVLYSYLGVAQARGLRRSQGHRAGAEAVRGIVTCCRRIGLRHLTLYTFSSENWSRPKTEISALFSLLLEFLRTEMPRMLREGISLKIFGDLDGLPFPVRSALRMAVKSTAGGREMDLNLALNYGSRQEIVRAVREIISEGIPAESVTEQTIADHLYTAGQPDPDFVIRTSGELRLSNYLLYQSAYSEFYFTPVAWPDFTPAEMEKALEAYAHRKRRFGKTQEQIDAVAGEPGNGADK